MSKIANFKSKNNFIVSLILSVIIVISFTKMDIIPVYNFNSLLILFLFSFLIYKTPFEFDTKREFVVNLVVSIIFSLLMVIGRNIYTYYLDSVTDIVLEMFSFRTIFHFISYLILFFVVLYQIFKCFGKLKLCLNNSTDKKTCKIIFCLSFLVIFVCWIPYFLTLYPGGVSPDSIGELTAVQNFSITSDHHPVLHQVFMFIFYHIGHFLFGNVNDSVAFISIIQMLFMALIFAYSITYLYKRNVNKKVLFFANLFYAISPIFGYYSVTMWKDVLFGAFFLLFSVHLCQLMENKKAISIKNLIMFLISSLLIIFFRNNAIYMYILFIPVAILYFKEERKKMIVCFTIVIGLFLIVKGPVYKCLNISKSSSSEYIAMPLQQIGRMAYKKVSFTNKEKKFFDELIPVEIMETAYNPTVSDGIKFNPAYNLEFFNDNKIEFFKIYIGLVARYPNIAVESYLTSTLGYWYPNVMYWSVANNVWENDIGVYNDSKAPKFIEDYVFSAESRNLPIISLQWSIGLCFWLILLAGCVCYLRKGFSTLLLYFPIFGIWLTMMIASPVWGEFRYVFCAFTCLPLLLLYPFLTNLEAKKLKK